MRIAVVGGTGVAAHHAVVPRPEARRAPTTFDSWLQRQGAKAA